MLRWGGAALYSRRGLVTLLGRRSPPLMKIVHVVNTMEMGGAESLVAQLARLQRANGHDVAVMTQRLLGTLGEALIRDGFRVQVHGEGHPVAKMPSFLRAFRELRPDVVHCHNPAPTIGAAMMARMAGTRRVISTRHSLVAPPYNLAEERRYGIAAKFCDAIVGICEATCVNLRGAPMARRDRIVRVYNGAQAVQPVTLEDLPARCGVTIAFVGRLAPVKDLGTMVRAYALARRRVPELRLWMVGDGDQRGMLEGLAEDLGVMGEQGVRFWGERPDADRFFLAADVFAMSSRSEGLPMSLLQAMSARRPTLVTDVGGMAEVVRNSGGGLTAPVGDATAMAEAMVRLASDRELRVALGERGLRAYEDGFTLERMDEAYMRVYRG